MVAVFTIPAAAEAIALFGVTLLLAAGLFYLAKRLAPVLRDAGGTPDERASELMSRFRDLHEQGGLSSGEYQNIKDQLTPLLQAESSTSAAEELVAAARPHPQREAGDSPGAGATLGAERAAETYGPDQRELTDPAGGAAGGGCDAAPSAGGDSTREGR